MYFNKKGFTMVELIVVIALIGIIGAGVIGFMAPNDAITKSAHKQADVKSIAMTLMDRIENEINMVHSIAIADNLDQLKDGEAALYAMTDKQIVIQEKDNESKPVFSTEFYNGTQVDVKFNSTDVTNLLGIELIFYQGEGSSRKQIYQLNDTIKCLNVKKIKTSSSEEKVTGSHIIFSFDKENNGGSEIPKPEGRKICIDCQCDNVKCGLKQSKDKWKCIGDCTVDECTTCSKGSLEKKICAICSCTLCELKWKCKEKQWECKNNCKDKQCFSCLCDKKKCYKCGHTCSDMTEKNGKWECNSSNCHPNKCECRLCNK